MILLLLMIIVMVSFKRLSIKALSKIMKEEGDGVTK